MTQGKAIFDIRGMAKAIRYTEYSSIYSALSEIVDNSLEAKASNVLVVCYEKINRDGGKEVGDIAIIDDGIGMDESVLHGCLVFGNSSQKETVGMGKFGVGLGQASMYAAPRVEVYSWQDTGSKKMVFLDSDLMSKGEQTVIEFPQETDLPDWLKGFLKVKLLEVGEFDFRKSGTIVIWKNVDHAKGILSKFYNSLSLELGRRFRNYINNGCKIALTNTQHSPRECVLPIDPMHLMENSRYIADSNPGYLGYLSDTLKGDNLFEPFISELTPNGSCMLDLRLERNGVPFVSSVKIKASLIKEKYYYEAARSMGISKPGDTPIGKLVRKYERVSILRVGREIQFDRFGLYESINEPENRWWRVEISFMPELDEFFSLSNNKQKVEIKLQYKPEKGQKFYDDETLEATAWRRILDAFDKIKRQMVSRNSALAKGAKEAYFKLKIEPKKVFTGSSLYTSVLKTTNPQNESVLTQEKSSLLTGLKDYSDCETENTDRPDLIDFVRENNEYKCYLNSNHNLYKKIKHNDGILLGMEIVLTAMANVKKNFKLYDENQVLDSLTKYLNEEFVFINEICEEEYE